MNTILVPNTCHTCNLVVFKNTFMMNLHFHGLRSSQNLSINVMKVAHIMPLNIKTFFLQYKEGFNFVSGKPSSDVDDTHITVPDGPPSLTPYTKANISDGFVIPQESQLYHKSENYQLFRKQNCFGAFHPNVQIDSKLDYMISRVLLEMDQTGLNIYKKLCDLDRDLKQTAFILLTQKFPLVGYIITGQRHTVATLKSQNVISLFQCKVVSSALYVI